ncbi:MAG: ATP-binding protein [Burkholderiales bacterium]|nr:ATP-binding protein [Burkholderiales bacterium]
MTPVRSPARRSRRFVLWLTALGFGLIFVIAPLTYVQYLQTDLLNRTQQYQNDSVIGFCYELEREYDRFRNALRDARLDPGPESLDALSLRYDILVSRIGLLQNNPTVSVLEPLAPYREAILQLSDFVRQTDHVLPTGVRPHLQDDTLATLWQQSAPLGNTLVQLTRTANVAVQADTDQRNETIRLQSRVVVGLAAVMCLIFLAGVTALATSLREKNRRQRDLEALTVQLREARVHADSANRSKSVFLANMSHEIRTPFNGLLGMITLLADTPLTPAQRSYLQTAQDSATHLLTILNDILDISSMESGKFKLAPQPVSLPALLSEVQTLMEVPARNKGLTLDFKLAPDLPDWIHTDPTRLRQILFNLISNSVKFTERGGVSLAVNVTGSGDAPGALVFTVRDSGIGMDATTRDNLFARFYQADGNATRKAGGTGLGLEISRNLARLMGGEITFESKAGHGTTFVITLPVLVSEPPAATPAAAPAAAGKATVALHVLVAEDQSINQKYLTILLEKLGHRVSLCDDGAQALALLGREPVDLVLMDVHMPVMDGLAATRAIRAMPGDAAHTPIVALTADAMSEAREQALSAGMDAVLTKPLQPVDLERLLREFGQWHHESTEAGRPVPRTDFVASNLNTMPPELIVPDAADVIHAETFRGVTELLGADRLNSLLRALFETGEGQIHKLGQALSDGNVYTSGQEAHKLKGTSMLLGFTALTKTTATIEQAALHDASEIKPQTRKQLDRDIAATVKALRALGCPVD